MSESGGPDGYNAGDWSCNGGSLTGHTVQIPLGVDVTCTLVNHDTPATLTLLKGIDPAGTHSTRSAQDWTLTATLDGVTDQAPVSGNGGDGVTKVPVAAGVYTLSESGPAGFTAGDWRCEGAGVDGARLTVANGADVVCIILNTAMSPTLTLVKQVDNGSTGTATGPATVSGHSGTDPVTEVAVPVGAYTLSESGGPAGYAASAWSCDGATVADGTVTLADGQHATCTITNAAVAPTLTLVKQVDNQHGGTATPQAWTLTATGPATINGTNGSAAVTGARVPAGSYSLSESGGPGGYQATAWSCTGGTQSGDVVTAALGDHITCTIVNHDTDPGSTRHRPVVVQVVGRCLEPDSTPRR